MLVSKPRIKKADWGNQAQTNRLVIILKINYSWKLDSDCFFIIKFLNIPCTWFYHNYDILAFNHT
jgi:hypothetical protein